MSTHDHTKLSYAIPCILSAGFLNAIISAVAKSSFGYLSPMEMVLGRNVISLILFLFFLFFVRRERSLFSYLKPHVWSYLIICGIFSGLSIFFFYYAIEASSLTSAMVLFNTMPIFVPVVAFLWKGSKIYHRLWVGIVTAFIGVVLIIGPDKNLLQGSSLSALLSGMCGAVSMLAFRYAHRTETTERILVYNFFITSILAGLLLPISYAGWRESMAWQGWASLAILGGIGVIFQTLYVLSTKYAPAKLISPFYYSSVVFCAILDYLLWKIKIDLLSAIGFGLVFVGICLVVFLYPKELTTFQKEPK